MLLLVCDPFYSVATSYWMHVHYRTLLCVSLRGRMHVSLTGRRLLSAAVTGLHLERVQEAAVLNQLRVDVVQLCHTYRGRLPHIRIVVLCTGHTPPVKAKQGGCRHSFANRRGNTLCFILSNSC